MKKDFCIPPAPSHAQPVFGLRLPWLAPLAGYSDLPFRLLCREYGACVCETEMISAKGLCYQSPGSAEYLASLPEDAPLVPQLFGGEPKIMAQALKLLREAGYAAFDCNMGCSVRKVMRQGAGAALLASPEQALAVAKAMLKAAKEPGVKPQAMVGFKLRLGMHPGRQIMTELALRLQEAGADWLCVHPRYASQGFAGVADWEELEKLSPQLEIPLLASGDLMTAEAGLNCIAQTGVTGVMYARGALHNPAIFRDHLALAAGSQLLSASIISLRAMILRHIALARQFQATGNAFLKMRSLIPRYARFFPGVGELRKTLCQCQNWKEIEMALDEFLSRNISLEV